MSNGPPLGLRRSVVSRPYRSTGRTCFSVCTSTPATHTYPGCIRVRWFTSICKIPLQVNGPDAAPLPIQVLQNQTPVAMLSSGLAAQQHRRSLEEVPVQCLLDPTLPHELQEPPFVLRSSFSSLPVGIEHVPGRGEHRFV